MNLSFDSIESPALTKGDLAELLFEQLGLNKREAKDFIEEFFDQITHQLIEGQEIKIAGFGNFIVRTKKSRPGRNPKTGEPVLIKARRSVTFSGSAKLKKAVQEKSDEEKIR